MSVCESVDLPEPFGPITACTSPLEMLSETPFRICRPSTLARRSLISKSANLLFVLLHDVGAVVGSLSHPRRASHIRAEKPFVHVLLVDARQAGAGGTVGEGAVAGAEGERAAADPAPLGHVPVLRRETGKLAPSRSKF